MLKIVTDGAADMPDGWGQKYDIHILPLRIRFGDEELLQGRDVTSKNFYSLVKLKRLFPKTSLPAPAEIVDFYRNIAQKGDEIISIHVASKLSGTFAAAQAAADELAGELSVYPFDSGAGSAAQGYMCREARIMSEKGMDTSAIIEFLKEIRAKVMIYFTLEDLNFARLSGRINSFQTALSSLLKINPIIFLRNGLLFVGQKVRTRQRALDTIVENVRQRLGGEPANLAIVHAATPETAQLLIERVEAVIPAIKEIIVTELSIPVAAHLGPGAVGIVAIPVAER